MHGPDSGAWSVTAPPWLVHLPTCPSTNDWVLERLGDLAPGTVVCTARQTAGRGQSSRRWHSPPGTLTVTVVLHLASAGAARHLGLVAGLALIHALDDACPQPRLPLTLKWPNDVLLAGRKLAGILCEARSGADGARVAVGIGCNLTTDFTAAGLTSHDFPDLPRPPVALSAFAPPPAEAPFLATLRGYLLEGAGLLAAGGFHRLLPALRERDGLRGRSLTVTRADGGHLVGRGVGLDDDGRLLVETTTGEHAIDSGHVRETLAVPQPVDLGDAAP